MDVMEGYGSGLLVQLTDKLLRKNEELSELAIIGHVQESDAVVVLGVPSFNCQRQAPPEEIGSVLIGSQLRGMVKIHGYLSNPRIVYGDDGKPNQLVMDLVDSLEEIKHNEM